MSDSKFTPTTVNAAIKLLARINGKSWAKIALTVIRPIPGQAKIFSVITDPPRIKGKYNPNKVTKGKSEFFRA